MIRMAKGSSDIDFSGVAKPGEFDPIIIERVVTKLSLMQRLTLRLQGNVEVGHIRREGWRAELKCYLFECEEHGSQITTPSGHFMMLLCPRCIKERQLETEELKTHQRSSESPAVETKPREEVNPLPLPHMKDHR
jgi:hypothetical protein